MRIVGDHLVIQLEPWSVRSIG